MEAPEASQLPPATLERGRALAVAIGCKEAASKALGTGWSRGVSWRHVVVELGPPISTRLKGRAAEVAQALGSSGRTKTRVLYRDDLVICEVCLLS